MHPLAKQQTGGAPAGGSGGKGWLVPIIGAVAQGVIAWATNNATNRANAKNVQAQIDFQRDMANTSFQRGVEDLRAAGLNPALAYRQGGADSPGGAAAQYGEANLAQAVAAYNDFANATAQRQVIREQAGLTAAQTRKTLAEGTVALGEAMVLEDADYRKQYVKTRTAKGKADEYLAINTPRQFEANLGSTLQATATAKQQQGLMSSQQTLNEQQFMNAWFRKNIAPYINSTSKSLSVLPGGRRRFD